MSNQYFPWWNQTITVYNKYQDPTSRVILWYKTVLTGCFWKYVGQQVVIGQTVLKTDNTTCRVRIDDKFKERYLWDQIPNDQKSDYFTLSPGDIIVRGEVEDTVDEYTSGSRSSDLLTKYRNSPGCITIDHVTINVGDGRVPEHYHVVGV